MYIYQWLKIACSLTLDLNERTYWRNNGAVSSLL